MFGYIIPMKKELKVKELELFNAYYCGLCRTLEKKNIISSMVLKYDMVFLSILLSSIYDDKLPIDKVFCRYKFKKVNIVKDSMYMDYAADMNVLLVSRKLVDDYNDDHNIISLMCSKFFTIKPGETSFSKIKNMDDCLSNIKQLEKNKCNRVDEIADCFAKLTEDIFSVGLNEERKILKYFGYNIGKWIYTIDAYDDLVDDIKKKKYNPFIYEFNYKNEDPVQFKNSLKEVVKFTLTHCLEESSKAFELINIKKNKELIKNIIYLGMYDKTLKILDGGHKDEKSL